MKRFFTKPSEVMKICATQVMIAMIVCGVSAAHDNYAQLLDNKVTLSVREVPLEVALKKIEKAAHVRFFYSIDQLDLNESISIEAKDVTLRAVLDNLLSPHDIKYKVNERKRAIILKKQTDLMGESETDLMDKPFTPSKRYGAFIVTGRVLEADTQQPMAGVNIIVKGTTMGTTTDSEGKFSIEANEGDFLVFSFIGYTSFEVRLSGQSVVEVALKEDIANLKEVVINAGYYTTTRETQTGNISKVEAKAISRQPVSNPLASLQGLVPGLVVTQSTGVPGGNFVVRIRGQNSIGNGNDPLYIIDGVPFTSTTLSVPVTSQNLLAQGTNPLNMLNPSDIESIEVLKDADATAIYGSRGSNGVILITTETGKAGKTKVDFNFYSGFGKVASQLQTLTSQQYLEMRREAYRNSATNPSPSAAPDLLVWDTTRYTDWQKVLIGRTAKTTDAQLSLSGGSEQVQFKFGAGFHKETSVFPGDNADNRLSTHLNITSTSPNQKLRTIISVNYSINETDFINRDVTSLALSLPPVAPALYTENGDFNWGSDAWNASTPHPLQHLNTGYESLTKNLLANAQVEYSILPSMNFKVNLGYTDLAAEAITLLLNSYYYPPQKSFLENGSTFSTSHFGNWTIEPQLNWQITVDKDNSFQILAGSSFLNQTSDNSYIGGSGFANESLMKNINAASTISIGTVAYSQYRYQSFFGRINYSLKEKYIVNITGRRDGSSRFGSDKRYANFGAIGTAWVFSKEALFVNSISFLSFGKLRASYGITGNDQLGNYQYLDTYTTSRPYQGVPGLSPVRLSNPEFAWETNTKFEIGLDIGFLKDQIHTSLNYYQNESTNQLVGTPLPPTTGFQTIQSNSPATVLNSGIEIELNTQNVRTNKFQWTTFANVTVPKNELVKFPGLESSQYSTLLVVGEPLSIKKAYRYLGVDNTTGIYEFEDIDNDGLLNQADRHVVKFTGQKYYAGLQNTFQYNGIELSFLFQIVNQQGPNYITYASAPGGRNNQPQYILNRWREEGDNPDTQKFVATGLGFSVYNNYLRNSDKSIDDASYIRLKNVSLSYNFPNEILERVHMTRARIYINGQNLLTFTEYEGLDPETFGFALPPLRILTGGIQLTF